MSLLDELRDRKVWERFYEYKRSLACHKEFTRELRIFIDEKRYEPVCDAIDRGDPFPLPKRSVISKMASEKKRIVYTYPKDENTCLKLLTYLMLRKYDHLFSDNLYSFRPGRTAKDAVRKLVKIPDISARYSYKVDVSDYFNSIPVEVLLPELRSAISDDERLFDFLLRLLSEDSVIERGEIRKYRKGIMAGTPISSFFANLFLSGLDQKFNDEGVIYARYSDDIILFADTFDECLRYAGIVREYLSARGLKVNPKKECFTTPEDGFTFLGFSVCGNVIDIAPATVKKLKGKMKRKRDSLARWGKRNDVSGEQCAKAFIRIFNRKLLEMSDDSNDLTWSNWFFPVINTTERLHEIDLYAQDSIRYLISGRHTKARFNVRYEDLKKLGYKSLVHEYYKIV